MSVVRKIIGFVSIFVSFLISMSIANDRVKRGGFAHGGYGSPDLLLGAGVGGNLAYDQNQRNLFSLNAGDLGNAFDVGDYASSIAKATRTSAAAGSKFKGGYGKRR